MCCNKLSFGGSHEFIPRFFPTWRLTLMIEVVTVTGSFRENHRIMNANVKIKSTLHRWKKPSRQAIEDFEVSTSSKFSVWLTKGSFNNQVSSKYYINWDSLMQDSRSQDSRSKIPKSRSRNQDPEIKIQKSRSRNQDPEIKPRAFRQRTHISGS